MPLKRNWCGQCGQTLLDVDWEKTPACGPGHAVIAAELLNSLASCAAERPTRTPEDEENARPSGADENPTAEAVRGRSPQCDHGPEVACVDCPDRISVETPLEVRDGDWTLPDPQQGFQWGCCDCGLFHRVDFRIVENRVEMRVYRDAAKTEEWRRTKAHSFVQEEAPPIRGPYE